MVEPVSATHGPDWQEGSVAPGDFAPLEAAGRVTGADLRSIWSLAALVFLNL